LTDFKQEISKIQNAFVQVKDIKSEIKFDGNLNLTGFNGVDKGSTSAQIVVLFIDQFIKELDTSDPTQAVFAQKLNAAKKSLQQ
jgi:hypothetical protein